MIQIHADRVAPEKADFRPALSRVPTAGLLPEKAMDELAENVAIFLDKAAVKYGQSQEEKFHQDLWNECRHVNSPIEQLFLIALRLVGEENFVIVRLRDEFSDADDGDLEVVPQFKCGTYFADFALKSKRPGGLVCVELDGHAFHDRDEKQRRYEKKRDRYFTTKGHRVIHFTGSEVAKDPCAVALEAFNLATGMGDYAIHPFEDD
jgi:very-short-patch-repair endonuclease